MKKSKPRYRLVLEAITGPEDDETIEIKATWTVSGRESWLIHGDGYGIEMLNSIKTEVTRAKTGGK